MEGEVVKWDSPKENSSILPTSGTLHSQYPKYTINQKSGNSKEFWILVRWMRSFHYLPWFNDLAKTQSVPLLFLVLAIKYWGGDLTPFRPPYCILNLDLIYAPQIHDSSKVIHPTKSVYSIRANNGTNLSAYFTKILPPSTYLCNSPECLASFLPYTPSEIKTHILSPPPKRCLNNCKRLERLLGN